MSWEQRLSQRIERLQQQWRILNEKRSRLEEAKILETRAEEKFRLERQIDEMKTEIEQLEQEMRDLEDQLPAESKGDTKVVSQSHRRNKVFISYSREDSKWLKKLQVFLRPLERKGIIDYWDDTRIKPGQKWRDEIENTLSSARIAVFLVSSYFLASDFITQEEIPPILKAAEEDGALILSVILSPCKAVFFLSELAQYQTVNPPSEPLSNMSEHEQDEVFDKVANAIIEALT